MSLTQVRLPDAAPQEAPGERRVFVGITTPLAWAATPPLAGIPAGSGTQDEEGAACAPCCYTEQDAPIRQPAACAAAAHRAEQVVLRAARPGRLAAHVVLPGVLYGEGEGDGHLHGLFRAAWEGGSVQQAGTGANRLPTLHVSALAAYVGALAAASALALATAARMAQTTGPVARRTLQQQQLLLLQQQQQRPTLGMACVTSGDEAPQCCAAATAFLGPPQYLLVADDAPVTQGQLLSRVATAFGHQICARVEFLDSPAVGLLSPSRASSHQQQQQQQQQHYRQQGEAALLLPVLDLPLRTTPLAAEMPFVPWRDGSLLNNLESVAAEYVAARGLSPLRILVRGAPASGKSLVAARLSLLYGLPVVRASTILAEAPHCDADLQKVRCGGAWAKTARARALARA